MKKSLENYVRKFESKEGIHAAGIHHLLRTAMSIHDDELCEDLKNTFTRNEFMTLTTMVVNKIIEDLGIQNEKFGNLLHEFSEIDFDSDHDQD